MATTIEISDITSNVVTSADNTVSGDGYFDDLMETATTHLEAQRKKSYIDGDAYARVYASVMNNIINQAMQFALTKRSAELRADGLNEDVLKKQEDYEVQTGTDVRQAKIDTIIAQKDKTENEALYIAEQQTQLVNSVGYNNKIKTLDAFADTYGTFGAGGLTLSSDMWSTYFNLANDIAESTVPTSTTVTSVS